MHYWDAVLAFVVAMVVAALLTPFAAKLAWRYHAVSMPSERGLAERTTPLWGGLAILAGVLIAAALWMPATINLPRSAHTLRGSVNTVHTWVVLAGACLIPRVGPNADRRAQHPAGQLPRQIGA